MPRDHALRVTVIGCGPAGLAAVHAAVGLGAIVRIIGPRKMTPQLGPIMLHRPIPGVNTEQPDGYVRQIVIGGSILDYRLKLYGDVNIKINGDVLEPGFHTWSVPIAYKKMWDMYGSFIEDRMVDASELDKLSYEADLTICSAPAPDMCMNKEHVFSLVPIALKNSVSYPDQPDNTVIYNAYRDLPWVRSSSIFGAQVTEYKPEDCEHPDLVIRKPLSTDCDCHPRVVRIGRYGTWHNEQWIDHAYYDTRSTILSMQMNHEWEEIQKWHP